MDCCPALTADRHRNGAGADGLRANLGGFQVGGRDTGECPQVLGEPIEFGPGGCGDDEDGSKLGWYARRVGVEGRDGVPGDSNSLENRCS